MPTAYPTSVDTSAEQPSPSATTDLDGVGYEHDIVHTSHSGAIIAIETKLGSTDSNAVADTVLGGTGASASAWTGSPTLSGTVTATTFIGAVTGNITGNVTGDLTGNVTGNVTGDVTGNVTGDASGNLLLSGGTNGKTAEMARMCDVPYQGVSIGTHARWIVKEWVTLDDLEGDVGAIKSALVPAMDLVTRSIAA